jgi:hypothetical protein
MILIMGLATGITVLVTGRGSSLGSAPDNSGSFCLGD